MRSPGQGVSPSLNRSPASPSGLAGVRSKATLYTQQKSQQASVRSPITSGGCTTPSGRSPVAEGHSLTPSPLANIVPKLPVVVSGSSPTGGSCSSSSLASQSSVTMRLTTAPGVVPPLTCDICNKTFTSRSNLNKHKRVQHSGEEYVCPICRRTFRNRYYIKEHVLLCSTATQKKAAAAAASVVIGVPVSGAAMGMGLDEDDPLEAKVEEEEFDGLDDDQPTDLVLRRPASPT